MARHPLSFSFSVQHAKDYGLEEAIFLHNLIFWIRTNQANDSRELHYHEGRWWTYNSVKFFSEIYEFWSPKQIIRIVASLKEQGVIITAQFSGERGGNRLYYSVADLSLLGHDDAESTGGRPTETGAAGENVLPKRARHSGQNSYPNGQDLLPEPAKPFAQTGKTSIRSDTDTNTGSDNSFGEGRETPPSQANNEVLRGKEKPDSPLVKSSQSPSSAETDAGLGKEIIAKGNPVAIFLYLRRKAAALHPGISANPGIARDPVIDPQYVQRLNSRMRQLCQARGEEVARQEFVQTMKNFLRDEYNRDHLWPIALFWKRDHDQWLTSAPAPPKANPAPAPPAPLALEQDGLDEAYPYDDMLAGGDGRDAVVARTLGLDLDPDHH